jgi:hypothetical protein
MSNSAATSARTPKIESSFRFIMGRPSMLEAASFTPADPEREYSHVYRDARIFGLRAACRQSIGAPCPYPLQITF